MKAWVNFTRLESQDSYNLQFVIQRSSSLSCIGDITPPNEKRRLKRVREREREREVEMCGRSRCTLRADDIPRACYRNNSSVRNLHMDRSVLTTNHFSSFLLLLLLSIIILITIIYRYRPSYNVSPGHHLPVVRREQGSSSSSAASAAAAASESDAVVVHCMKWGLIPSFTKKSDKPDHYKMVLFLTSLSLSFFQTHTTHS